MKKVILDTNFIVTCARQKIDFAAELRRILDFAFEICILDSSLKELEIVVERGGKDAAAAKLAKVMLKAAGVKVLKAGQGKVDDMLVKFADENNLIATQDAGLKKRLKQKGQSVVVVRQGKYLSLG